MRATTRLAVVSSALWLFGPSAAFATSPGIVPRYVQLGVGGVALALAALMLLDVLALRRVASGAALAERITYVMAAVACLAASVLTRWFVRFSPSDDVAELAALGSELLVIAAMVFFALYFYGVRRAMVRFLNRFSDEESLALAQCEDGPDVAEASKADDGLREVSDG